MSRRSGGFTLIELLVVIIILGILAAVVAFAVDGLNHSPGEDEDAGARWALNHRNVTAGACRVAQEVGEENDDWLRGCLRAVETLESDSTSTTDLTTTTLG